MNTVFESIIYFHETLRRFAQATRPAPFPSGAATTRRRPSGCVSDCSERRRHLNLARRFSQSEQVCRRRRHSVCALRFARLFRKQDVVWLQGDGNLFGLLKDHFSHTTRTMAAAAAAADAPLSRAAAKLPLRRHFCARQPAAYLANLAPSTGGRAESCASRRWRRANMRDATWRRVIREEWRRRLASFAVALRWPNSRRFQRRVSFPPLWRRRSARQASADCRRRSFEYHSLRRAAARRRASQRRRRRRRRSGRKLAAPTAARQLDGRRN